MKILIFTSPHEDYLGDAVLHGFRKLFGAQCVDYPKCEILYKNCPEKIKNQVRGNGFSLYSGLLDDIEIDRFNIKDRIIEGHFDLIIFSSIQRQFGYFTQYRPWLTKNNTIIIDGHDTDQPYPARGFWWRRPYYWTLPKAHIDFLYFKREWTPSTHFNIWMRLFPPIIRETLIRKKNLRKINFAFPEEKIVKFLPEKQKKFPIHIVDSEIAKRISKSTTGYAFDSESDYYADLQKSKFGITTKRAGWDCLRHYEIAANGTVICFKNLNKKSGTCAPHGLNDRNSITYTDYSNLLNKINAIDENSYKQLQKETLNWIKTHTTTNLAKRIIKEFKRQ